jgi:hypothetical protein
MHSSNDSFLVMHGMSTVQVVALSWLEKVVVHSPTMLATTASNELQKISCGLAWTWVVHGPTQTI